MGVSGVIQMKGNLPGPHIGVFSLMHGNEYSGAIALDELLRGNFQPYRGTISFAFLNISAFECFDPLSPLMARFVDEDMNRLWSYPILRSHRQSTELNRARELLPFIESTDIVIDLHSMLWGGERAILCNRAKKNRLLAKKINAIPLIITDSGHTHGPRLIDFEHFTETGPAQACLIEGGYHWSRKTVNTLKDLVSHFLNCAVTNLSSQGPARKNNPHHSTLSEVSKPVRWADVTHIITANTNMFEFVRPVRGGDIIAKKNTLLAFDGKWPIYTPYNDCMIVLPNLMPSKGHTALRMAIIKE
ncbi:hypothetical protein JGUZn3_16980 [Entomobacter blattae]|uniref:Succinylglutamate desuccinylase/Aspartoacylase catalytic domain-containing protein n=2 Tax=Entomobacter blattae TaxID=2762277 RepID=A0A7H1NT06_9PROT|nr:hypothetical protein JGUZn3_16980 [Entomobacter blattae]